MNFTVTYTEFVLHEDINQLPKPVKKRIKKAIEMRLMTRPEVYGKALSHSLKNNRKLRVGDYRVVFRIEKRRVIIWAIGHRSVIYAKAIQRLFNRPAA